MQIDLNTTSDHPTSPYLGLLGGNVILGEAYARARRWIGVTDTICPLTISFAIIHLLSDHDAESYQKSKAYTAYSKLSLFSLFSLSSLLHTHGRNFPFSEIYSANSVT